jgi:hypothetical protein
MTIAKYKNYIEMRGMGQMRRQLERIGEFDRDEQFSFQNLQKRSLTCRGRVPLKTRNQYGPTVLLSLV